MQVIAVLLLVAAAVATGAIVKRQAGVSQDTVKVWSALDTMRGSRGRLEVGAIQDIYKNARAGDDYPNLAVIPDTNTINCANVKPGFYADTDPASRCQVIRRCDINGNLTSYLCPNMTIFNQITLICDWFYNVDCSQARNFYDYSNSRLYQPDRVLLDNQNDYQVAAGLGALPAAAGATPAPAAASPEAVTAEATTEATAEATTEAAAA